MQRELVEQAMSGDHAAFSELARNSAGRLLVLARLILHDDAAAEDATQEALVAAWRHIKGLRDPDRFDAWLHRLLVNECHREARGRHSRRTLEIHIPAFDAPEPDGVDSLLDRDQLDRGSGVWTSIIASSSSSTTTSAFGPKKPPKCWGCPRARSVLDCIEPCKPCGLRSRRTLGPDPSRKEAGHDPRIATRRDARPDDGRLVRGASPW